MEDELVTFTQMEEIYETTIDEAKKINKGKLRALQPERAVRLAAQRMSLHSQVTEILDCVKDELEKAEFTKLREALKTQRELLSAGCKEPSSGPRSYWTTTSTIGKVWSWRITGSEWSSTRAQAARSQAADQGATGPQHQRLGRSGAGGSQEASGVQQEADETEDANRPC